MRNDMFKVIVERPRFASRFGTKTKHRYLRDAETPYRMTGKQVLRYKKDAMHKHLNENLAPLKRYLFKQRGRKWDDIFSEICAHLDTNSTIKMHVRDHLDDFILRKVFVDEDGHFFGTTWRNNMHPPDLYRWPALYVCPYDGRVKETRKLLVKLGKPVNGKDYRKHGRRADIQLRLKANFRRLSEVEFLVRCNHIWFRFELTAPPRTFDLNALPIGKRSYPLCDAAILEKLSCGQNFADLVWAVKSKKQLSKKELKQFGLKNGGADD